MLFSFSREEMKFLLLLLLIPVKLLASTHFISTNLYIVENKRVYSVNTYGKMSEKFFNFLTSSVEEPLHVYSKNFSSIRFIDFYVPNKIGAKQIIVVGFNDKTIKKIKVKKYFNFESQNIDKDKVFSVNFLQQLQDKNKLALIPQTELKDNEEYYSEYIYQVSSR